MAAYKIVRHYFRGFRKRVVKRGLTLDEAKLHCADPETSSSTCIKSRARMRTRDCGPWFDSFEEDN